MGKNIGVTTLLYALGAILGVASVFHFGFEIIQDFSPVTKSAMLFMGFFLFIGLGSYVGDRMSSGAMYVLAAGTYLVFLAYTFAAFEIGSDGVFVVLAVSSALFIGLGYLKQQGRLDADRELARNAIIGLLVLGVLLAGIDILGAQPTTSTDVVDEIDLSDVAPGDRLTLGTVTATNEFFLPRNVDAPQYRTCLYVDGERLDQPAAVDERIDRIGGNSQETMTLEYRPARAHHQNMTQTVGVIPVEEQDSCPDTSDTDQLIVVPDRDREVPTPQTATQP